MSAPATFYTAPAAPEKVRTRARRNIVWIAAVGLIVALAVSIAVTQQPTDYKPLSINNYTENGARAVAQILRAQGADVRQVSQLGRVLTADAGQTTLVIAAADLLSEEQVTSVLSYEGDVVFLGANDDIVAGVDDALSLTYDFLPETVDAACADPDASAAERMRVEFSAIKDSGSRSAELCFPNRASVYGMAVVPTDHGTRTILTNPAIFMNGSLLNDGNAALSLRTAGHHPKVVWYLSDGYDRTVMGDPGEPTELDSAADVLPPGFGTALYALALAALIAALWKGRRFGPLAVEPLPVVVRASEATRGRARLYRRARATGRATAALRAASAKRIGARLGLPRTTQRDEMVAAVQRATDLPAPEIARILYGPPPTNDAEMIRVVDELDSLEGKVHGL